PRSRPGFDVILQQVRSDSVSRASEPGHLPDTDACDTRDAAKLVARVCIRDVYLHDGNDDRFDRIAKCNGGVRERAGIQDDAVRELPALVEEIDERTLVVALEGYERRAARTRRGGHIRLDVQQRRCAVHLGLAFDQQIEVRAVDEEEYGIFDFGFWVLD